MRRFRHSRFLVFPTLGLLAFFARPDLRAQPPPQPPPPRPPTIEFEPGAFKVSDLQPGEKVVVFSIAHEASSYVSTIVRREELLADDDNDGVARFSLDRAIPRRSIWLAVNFASGELAVGTPADYPLREVHVPPTAIQADLPGRWRHDRSYVEFLVVRPGVGAWSLSAGDGAEGDADRNYDGSLEAELATMEPFEGSPAPPEDFAAGDVVMMVDPDRMEFFAVRLKGQRP